MVDEIDMGDNLENLKPYKVNISEILADTNLDRNIKDIASENIELKNEIYRLMNRLTATREMIEKYTLRTDELMDEKNVKRTKVMKDKIEQQVQEIKLEKDENKRMKVAIIDLAAHLDEKKVEL